MCLCGGSGGQHQRVSSVLRRAPSETFCIEHQLLLHIRQKPLQKKQFVRNRSITSVTRTGKGEDSRKELKQQNAVSDRRRRKTPWGTWASHRPQWSLDSSSVTQCGQLPHGAVLNSRLIGYVRSEVSTGPGRCCLTPRSLPSPTSLLKAPAFPHWPARRDCFLMCKGCNCQKDFGGQLV